VERRRRARRKKLLEVAYREWRYGDPKLPKDCGVCREKGAKAFRRVHGHFPKKEQPVCFAAFKTSAGSKRACAWSTKAEGVELTPAALDAWTVFCLSATQWNHAGMDGTRVGLIYSDVEAAARLEGIEVTPRVFYLLRLLEAKRLSIWKEESDARAETAKAAKAK
jgi:hypothetical protein